MIIVVFGVSGSGKTTIGKKLSQKLQIPFFDADDFHPQSNIDKMSSGESLNDQDRYPWLLNLSRKIGDWSSKEGAVLACSALKESYRDILSSQSEVALNWVHLFGTETLIQKRIDAREGHFMNPNLVRSQFDTLEVPKYGIHVDVDEEPETIINTIISKLSMRKSFFGVIGLGVMGSSLSLNVAEKGYSISVYNRTTPGEEEMVSDFLKRTNHKMTVQGHTDIKDFINSLERPRKILIMIKAGNAIDYVLEELQPLLSQGDVTIDGGNSHYVDTERRYQTLKKKGIHFIGCGVSGGEEGARRGPSIMPGGSKESYQIIAPVFEAIAAKDKNNDSCCAYIGEGGSGHFVKMVHNGIEYGEMQLLAELYALLSLTKTNEEIASIFAKWNQTNLPSYLLEITIDILRAKENGKSILDTILDKAGNKGTGSWSTKAAFDLGTVNTMMSSAVFARYVSSFKKIRKEWSQEIPKKEATSEISIETLEKSYHFARIINHHQGFELIRRASHEFQWNLNLSEIARIWTNGCIIRSKFMEKSIEVFQQHEHYLEQEKLRKELLLSEKAIAESIQYAISNRVSLDVFWSAYNYWVSITTEKLPMNIIQAQRDYFGAHTYQKIGVSEDQFFHTNWSSL